MTTLDRITTELDILQQELSELHHYTDELGKAKDASSEVIAVSKKFLSTFQLRVSAISDQMNHASDNFKQNCLDSCSTFQKSSQIFNEGIADAQNSLLAIGRDLSTVADSVGSLASKLDSIDIIGNFRRTQDQIASTELTLINNHKKVTLQLERQSEQYFKRLSTVRTITLILLITFIMIIGVGAFLIFKYRLLL